MDDHEQTAVTWRDLIDELTADQIGDLERLECQGDSPDTLLFHARMNCSAENLEMLLSL